MTETTDRPQPLSCYCRKHDAEIQRKIDRGIWRPSMDTGHIYSTEKHANLKETANHSGYCVIGRKKDKLVSRVIWIAAYGLPEIGMEVDHINGNKTDNRLENLQLVTPSENVMRSFAVLTFADAEEIRRLHKSGQTKAGLAKQYHVSPRTIGRITSGKTYKSRPPHELNKALAKLQIAALDSEAIAEICAEYQNGASYRQISNRWHITTTTIRTIIHKGGRP